MYKGKTMERVSLKQAREQLPELLNRVSYNDEIFEFTRYGKPVGVLVSEKRWKEACRIMDRIKFVD